MREQIANQKVQIMSRIGYRGFLSLVLMLFKINRMAKLAGLTTKVEITLPLKWTA